MKGEWNALDSSKDSGDEKMHIVDTDSKILEENVGKLLKYIQVWCRVRK